MVFWIDCAYIKRGVYHMREILNAKTVKKTDTQIPVQAMQKPALRLVLAISIS